VTYVGGLRDRLIQMAAFDRLQTFLQLLGWFDASATHKAVRLLARQVDADERIEPNVVAFTGFSDDAELIEIGSGLIERTRVFYADVYAEDESVLTHLAGDIRDIWEGRFASLGQTGSELEVLDYLQATPSVAFVVDIVNVTNDRVPRANQPWERFWRSVRFEVEDEYDDDLYSPPSYLPDPSATPGPTPPNP
jgi:hypothetical protein